MTHPDTPRPPMSETVKPLTDEQLKACFEVNRHYPDIPHWSSWVTQLEFLYARVEKAERDLAQSGEMEWPALNDDLIAILGRPNFHCANVANILRKGGTSIPTKSEHEQAHTIHFLMGMYLKHGKDRWAEEAEKALRAIIGLPPPTTGSAP